MAAPLPSAVSQNVQIFLPLTDLPRCWDGGWGSGAGSGDVVGEGEVGEEERWDQEDEGFPTPDRREPVE